MRMLFLMATEEVVSLSDNFSAEDFKNLLNETEAVLITEDGTIIESAINSEKFDLYEGALIESCAKQVLVVENSKESIHHIYDCILKNGFLQVNPDRFDTMGMYELLGN